MNLKPQKRMSAEILKCGENRVYFDPYLEEDISLAITREDIRNLIKQGAIKKKNTKREFRNTGKIYNMKGRKKV